MGLLFKNNAETTLSSGINDAVTTVPVASAAVFPTPNANNVFFATLDDGTNIETVKVTAISSNDLTVVRAQDNTSAAAFGSGAKIELRLNAKVLEMGTASLTDLDGDTQVLVEEAADEDKIKFKAAGTEIARIDSTGLGIGGINPTQKLTVDGNIANISGDMIIDCAADIILDADGGNIEMKDDGLHFYSISRSGDNAIIQSVISDGDVIIQGNDGGSTITALTLDMSDAGNATFNGTVNAGLKFINNAWNASAEGQNRFYFGTSSHTYLGTGDGYYFRNSSDNDVVIFNSAGSGFFDGNVTAYYSDERLKDKQGKIENALDKVEQIETFYFTENELAKSLGHTVDKKQVGVSAQSVYEVLPEIVDLAPFDRDHETGESKSGEDYMTVDYAKLTPLLIEAIKELQAKVKELEDK
nr:hypothetical protein [uncultured Mediterranean phage uvMED]